jgi:hypothetical protein
MLQHCPLQRHITQTVLEHSIIHSTEYNYLVCGGAKIINRGKKKVFQEFFQVRTTLSIWLIMFA